MSTFTSHDVADNNATQLSRLNQNLSTTKQLIGASASVEYTIASGSITPSVAVFTVDTESDAASDDLANILTTNLHTGAIVAIAAANAGRTVTVKHNAGGSGQITLDGSADRALTTTSWLILRRSGSNWVEMAINELETPSVVTTRGDLIVGDASGDESRLAIGTSGQVLTSDGTDASWSTPSGGGAFPTVVSYTANDTFVVPAGVTDVMVTMTASGGGGGQASVSDGSSRTIASGGGGGGSCKAFVSGLTPGENITLTVGAAVAQRLDGNSSSFGTYITCTGGKAGSDSVTNISYEAVPPGDPGSVITSAPVGGSIEVLARPSTSGFNGSQVTTNTPRGGNGGSSLLGSGGAGGVDANGVAGSGYGSGGGGGGSTGATRSGGSSAAGKIIIEYYS